MQIKKLIYKLKAFSYAALAGLQFNLVGQLGGNEILAAADSLSLNAWKKLYHDIPDIRKINIAYIIMLLFQVLSDVINHSESHNYIRGWAAIIMAIITLNFLAKILLKSFDSIIFYFIGGTLYLIFFKPQDDYSIGDIEQSMGTFKFWLVPILNNLVLMVSWFIMDKNKKSSSLVAGLLMFYGLFCMAFDARSNGIFFIITGLIFLFKDQLVNYSRQKAILLLIVFLAVFEGLYVIYVKEAMTGKIGGAHTEEQLSRINYSYNPLNLLFSGRTEFFVAIVAIEDQPIFGFGSWAPDPTGKYLVMVLEMQDDDQKIAALLKSDLMPQIIPAHSILIGAWLDGGIGAFIAIFFIFILFLKRCLYLLSNKDIIYSKYFPILIFFMLDTFWTFLFSPLPHIKDTLPIMIAFVMVMYKKSQDQKDAHQNSGGLAIS